VKELLIEIFLRLRDHDARHTSVIKLLKMGGEIRNRRITRGFTCCKDGAEDL
jgi:hypothetical protein